MENTDVVLIGVEDEESLGIRSIAAFLNSRGIRTVILPFRPGMEESVFADLSQKKPAIVGFSLLFQVLFDDFSHLIQVLRNRGIGAHFTMGGHFPTLNPEKTFELIPELDTIIRHEGELTFLELYQHVSDRDSWEKIPGLAFRKDGTIIITPARPLIENLDILPFSLRDRRLPAVGNFGIASMTASRGCHFNCTFCSIQKFYSGAPGPRRRSRSPGHVVREMKELHENLNARIFMFKDDDFGMKSREQQKWIRTFADGLKKEGLADTIFWKISCRIDETDEQVLSRLRKAGLGIVYLGIESGNEAGLVTCNKHYHVPDIFSSLEAVMKAGVFFDYGFMMFDPDSTFESLRENIDFLEKITRDGYTPVQFSKMLPYVGTEIEKRLRNEDRLKGTTTNPYYDYSDTRINLFESYAFRIFGPAYRGDGLIHVLKRLKVHSLVVSRFGENGDDARKYERVIRDSTADCNTLILSHLRTMWDFMQKNGYCEILDNSSFLDDQVRRYHTGQRDLLMNLADNVKSFTHAG
jgi:anaerobic magnesium-protoporphyrin IX monomethyl ester cyclase